MALLSGAYMGVAELGGASLTKADLTNAKKASGN
jgi:hypothetical protein